MPPRQRRRTEPAGEDISDEHFVPPMPPSSFTQVRDIFGPEIDARIKKIISEQNCKTIFTNDKFKWSDLPSKPPILAPDGKNFTPYLRELETWLRINIGRIPVDRFDQIGDHVFQSLPAQVQTLLNSMFSQEIVIEIRSKQSGIFKLIAEMKRAYQASSSTQLRTAETKFDNLKIGSTETVQKFVANFEAALQSLLLAGAGRPSEHALGMKLIKKCGLSASQEMILTTRLTDETGAVDFTFSKVKTILLALFPDTNPASVCAEEQRIFYTPSKGKGRGKFG